MFLSNIEKRLQDLGLTLPQPPKPAGSYAPYMLSGDLLYISGVTPKRDGVLQVKGRVGQDLTIEEAQAGARLCALTILSIIKSAVTDLSRIDQLLKVTGYVSCTGSFDKHPQVIDGASELFLELLGERGRHARCALGAASLPGGAAVEVDAVLKVRIN